MGRPVDVDKILQALGKRGELIVRGLCQNDAGLLEENAEQISRFLRRGIKLSSNEVNFLENEVPLDDSLISILADTDRPIEQQIEYRELWEIARQSLSDRQLQVITSIYVEDQNRAEIGRSDDVSRSMIDQVEDQALLRLRRKLR